MITIEFGKAEKQTLDSNSLFIKLMGNDFKENLDRIKKFWNRTYLKETHEWEVPYSCLKEIQELYKDVPIKYLNEPPHAKIVEKSDILEGMDFNGYKLYDYQIEGVKYGLNHHNFLLLDEQGCGKTLQALVIARYKRLHRNLKHCLIVCGVNSLKWNWIREIEKFCKEERGIILGTRKNSKGKTVSLTIEETKKQIQSCPEEFFWIINIEKMRLSSEEKKEKTGVINYLNEQIESGNLGMLILDEAHVIKNVNSAQAKGLLALNPKIDKMLMTGTLLVNNPIDLYPALRIAGLINESKWAFEQKYVIKDDWNRPVGFKNMNELHQILYKSSIRRTKDMLNLPEKVYKQEWLEFSNEEQKVFDDLTSNTYNGKYLDKIDPIFEPIVMVTRIRQLSVAAELITSKVNKSTKFSRLNDILEEARNDGKKVLVFCPFSEALKLGTKYCAEYEPKLVIGGMGQGVQEVVDEHENSEGFSVIFAQEKTLGVGYTLKNTSIVVFLSPPWNAATYEQCVDRTHRIRTKEYSTSY